MKNYILVLLLLLLTSLITIISATNNNNNNNSTNHCYRITSVSSTDQNSALIFQDAIKINDTNNNSIFNINLDEYQCLLKCSYCAWDGITTQVSLPPHYELCVTTLSDSYSIPPSSSPSIFNCVNATDIYAFNTLDPLQEINCNSIIIPGTINSAGTNNNPCKRLPPPTLSPTPSLCIELPEWSSTSQIGRRVIGIERQNTSMTSFAYYLTFRQQEQSSMQCSVVVYSQSTVSVSPLIANRLCVRTTVYPADRMCNNFNASSICHISNEVDVTYPCPDGYRRLYPQSTPAPTVYVRNTTYKNVGRTSAAAESGLVGLSVGLSVGLLALLFVMTLVCLTDRQLESLCKLLRALCCCKLKCNCLSNCGDGCKKQQQRSSPIALEPGMFRELRQQTLARRQHQQQQPSTNNNAMESASAIPSFTNIPQQQRQQRQQQEKDFIPEAILATDDDPFNNEAPVAKIAGGKDDNNNNLLTVV
jgi:hypothetical protein